MVWGCGGPQGVHITFFCWTARFFLAGVLPKSNMRHAVFRARRTFFLLCEQNVCSLQIITSYAVRGAARHHLVVVCALMQMLSQHCPLCLENMLPSPLLFVSCFGRFDWTLAEVHPSCRVSQQLWVCWQAERSLGLPGKPFYSPRYAGRKQVARVGGWLCAVGFFGCWCAEIGQQIVFGRCGGGGGCTHKHPVQQSSTPGQQC
jgi:hypothetical protein